MKSTDKPENCKLTHVLIPFISLVLLSTQIFAQQETKSRSFSIHAGIHAGINSGVISNAFGPSLSFHHASRTEKVIQFESMLFFDRHSGRAFLSGDQTKFLALGLAAGVRMNILPQKNWNPSFVIMLGPAYGSESANYRGLGFAYCLGFSYTFHKKHMLSIGVNAVEGREFEGGAIYIKYGFWF